MAIKNNDTELSSGISNLMKSYDIKNKKGIQTELSDQDKTADLSKSLDNILDFKTESKTKSKASIEDSFEDLIGTAKNNKTNSEDSVVTEEKVVTKTKKKSKKKKKSLAYNIIMTVLVCVFVGSAAYLINYYVKSRKSEAKFEELRDLIIADEPTVEITTEEPDPNSSTEETVKPPPVMSKPEFVEVDGRMVLRKYSELYKRNHDFLGWLTIGKTVVNYPVMYTPKEQDYYLHRDFDREASDSGTLFVDNNCDIETPGDNLIIYGHNMLSGKMFASITNYDDEEYYKKNRYIQFDTIDGEGVYEVIAAFRSKIYEVDYKGFKYYRFYGSKNEEEFNDYVNNCRSKTPYNTADAEYGDKLITLSTCAYHTKNGRFVVVAKKLNK